MDNLSMGTRHRTKIDHQLEELFEEAPQLLRSVPWVVRVKEAPLRLTRSPNCAELIQQTRIIRGYLGRPNRPCPKFSAQILELDQVPSVSFSEFQLSYRRGQVVINHDRNFFFELQQHLHDVQVAAFRVWNFSVFRFYATCLTQVKEVDPL